MGSTASPTPSLEPRFPTDGKVPGEATENLKTWELAQCERGNLCGKAASRSGSFPDKPPPPTSLLKARQANPFLSSALSQGAGRGKNYLAFCSVDRECNQGKGEKRTFLSPPAVKLVKQLQEVPLGGGGI
jgi:hypothetical protein